MSLHDTLSPSEIPAAAEAAALRKVNEQSLGKTLVLGFLAGVYIAMGGLLSLLVGSGFPEWAAMNPGLAKLLAGAMFPIGLILVVFAGAELFTGNNATLIPGLLNKRYGTAAVAKNWTWVWLSNFVGAVFFAYVMVYLTGVIATDPWHSAIIRIAEAKTSMAWHVVFIKGIGANWLVCLAVWLGLSARSAAGKMLGLWFPVMCFVAIGFEHSIANMFFIPSGMFQGAQVSWASLVWDNLIPATLGNIVGGALFVGGAYWYAYHPTEPSPDRTNSKTD
jgi:formate/nitrite transporter